ncbi:EAL domain-containing protein [Egibacter rhizosphaerae]|uniref:EAL domain-containing protein n=1 Tax=Egibacter rhizosphaerae TaxID=1670831 RepID=A0A411YIB8_9ACTN|nr:EAL domain-containing protein [Egibacter rhizosphaerae]QBI21055.1 EAL domain-containing protein [Egibacter rhizosphaerae]
MKAPRAATAESFSRLLKGVLGLGQHRPGDLVGVVRTLFFRFAVLNMAFVVTMLLGSEAPTALRLAGLASMLVVLGWWVRGRRRGRMPVSGLAIEAPALAVVAIGTGDPAMTLGLMYVALNFRAMYGSTRAAAALGVSYLLSHLVAVAVAEAAGTAGPATTLLSPVVLTQVPGFALTVVVMRVLVAIADRRDREQRAQEILTETGVTFTGAQRAGDVLEAAQRGAAALASRDRPRGAAVALHEDRGLTVRAASDPALVGLVLDPTAGGANTDLGAANGPRRVEADAVRVLGLPWDAALVAPLSNGSSGGMLLAETGDQGLEVPLASLAAQTTLALDRVRATAGVAASEALFSSLAARASDVSRVIAADATILYESEAVRHVLGHEPQELVGRSGFELIHPDDRPRAEQLLPTLFENPDRPVTTQLRMRHADGSWRHVEGALRNLLDDPAVGGIVINYRDVTERHRLEEQLREQALHDGLTGLPNRNLFTDRVGHALARQGREGDHVGLLFLDVDDFKTLNDGLGHAAGDEVLRTVSQRLQATARASDTCARLGGDEFAVVVDPVADEVELHQIGQRTLDALSEPVRLNGTDAPVGVSVGVVLSRGHESVDEFLAHADLAMYRAKDAGKGRVEPFHLDFSTTAQQRLQLRTELESGSPTGEFLPYYQPIVELQTGRTVGAEVLVRWEHPHQGVLEAEHFLPLAESARLMTSIGREVLSRACAESAAWLTPEGSPSTLSLNISASELRAQYLDGLLQTLLRDTGRCPSELQIELNSSTRPDDLTAARPTLQRLASLGMKLVVDDFPAGPNALHALRYLPVSGVKLSRQVIDDLDGEPSASPLAAGLLRLAETMGLEVVATGVERPTQAERLRQLGCHRAQGFHFGEPQPAAALADRLTTRPTVPSRPAAGLLLSRVS